MTLAEGTRIGGFEVWALIGAGGMGEVYRATDTKLGRDVAIKLLPEAFASDPERLARFEREARVLASLNHPSIAHLYGFETATGADGRQAHMLVMELAEGEDLSVRLKRGPIPLDEALTIAIQVAEALDEAHEKGIVHRDLKPANVKLSSEGRVKVLDYGLAKAFAGEFASGSAADLSQSPTLALSGTAAGVILGTAAYMSPEQARGKMVDKRADIWAFGVVLFEMLTGKRLFEGETVSDVLAGVLAREPDWTRLPASTPPGVRRLLRRCLAKDRRERLRDIGDAREELRELSAPEPLESLSKKGSARAWLPWSVAVVAIAIAAWALSGRTPVSRGDAEGHFTIELPDEAPLVTLEIPGVSRGPLAMSPDGRQIVYVAPHQNGTQLYARAMADLTPRALPGTEGASAPFFSPDGQWVGFFADGKLRKAPLIGGTPATLAEAPDGRGASWSPSGEIVFAPRNASGLFVVPDTGGTPRPVTTLDFAAGDDAHGWPQVIPGHRGALFTVTSWSRETSDIALVDLSTGARRLVQEGVEFARYVPVAPGASAGHILFVHAGALMAAPFDPAGAQAAGPPIAVVEGVRAAEFDVSIGVLAYTPGSGKAPDYSLVWVDRAGQARPINDLSRGYEDLHLSPDGRRVALTVEEAGPYSAAHVWLADTDRGTLTRFTFEGFSRDPIWTPDGEAVVFGSKRREATFGLYRQRLDGQRPADLLWASPTPIWPDPQSFTPDGRTLVFTTKGTETSDDIWKLSLDDDRTATPWLATPAAEWAGRLSPDGRWMAYNSDESGRDEVYVQPFPGPGGKWLVSEGGGYNAIWSRDGRELFYRRADQILRVEVETERGFAIGKRSALFSGRYRSAGRDFDISPDGTRFVMMRNDDSRTTNRLRVLLDWRRALEARVRTDGN
ncbi:MAG TPA: protein kinase [Vicinamibacteria bacterium]|nr:protein kinase [Vicinamibacteria bacterium]